MFRFFFTTFILCAAFGFSQNSYWNIYASKDQNKDPLNTPKSGYFIVKILDNSTLNTLAKKKINVVRTLTHTEYIVYGNSHTLKSIPTLKFKKASNDWKLLGSISYKKNKNKPFIIKSSQPQALQIQLKKNEIKIDTVFKNYIQVFTTLKKIKQYVLPLTHVSCVSTESFTPTQELLISDYNPFANAVSLVNTQYPELNGKGFAVGVKDNKPFANDIDVGSKIITTNLTSETEDLHATIMSSLIAGNGNSGNDATGVVPKAQIFSTDFKNLSPDAIESLRQHKITVQNHSYGTKIENFYGFLAAEYDTYIYDNPEITHIFSSGNSGTENNGASNLTGNFKLSKNSICVGAINNNNQVISESSKGPTFDNRIKPEIVTYSSIGTSNAAALVSGITQKLQQFYFESKNKIAPSYLMKALLLNGADDVGPTGIDFETGFGSVNTATSIEMLKNKQYFLNEIISNETTSFEITIPEKAKQLKILLVWNDVAANPNDAVVLKNDLDMTVTDSDTTFLPWVISNSTNSRAEDHINPQEQVTIENPTKEKYTVNIKANSLVTASQKFALVYSYKIKDQFNWVFPHKGSNINATDINTHFLRWNATFEKDITGSIEVDYNHTDNWVQIAQDIPLETSFFNWMPPEITTPNARIKLTTATNQTFVSDPFEIYTKTALNIGFNCSDQFELHWKKDDSVRFYEVYGINNSANSPERIAQTTDTTLVVTKQNRITQFYLTPFATNEKALTRSNTITTSDFEEKCYFENILLLQNRTNDNLTVTVQLNSLFAINELLFFKNSNAPVLIESRTSIENLLQTYQTQNLEDAVDLFFEIHLKDGTILTSESILPPPNTPPLIFPNPASHNTSLSINVSKLNTLYLFNLQGELILQKKLNIGTNILNINMATGTYITILEDTNGKNTTQKLIIN